MTAPVTDPTPSPEGDATGGAAPTRRADPTADPSGGTGHVPSDHVPVVRRVHFDVDDVPVHWVRGHPLVTHVANVFNILLPPGERWFCRTFREALPLVEDDLLRAQVKGFIGQESIHGRNHNAYIDRLADEGWPVDDLMATVERRFTGPGDRIPLPARAWLVASIEIYTAMLAGYVFETDVFASAHPAMHDMFLWHLAEEAEHKSVAHDLATALDPSYRHRIVAGVFVVVQMQVQLAWLLVRLLRADPEIGVRRAVHELWRERRHLAELARRTGRSFRRSLRRDYHPSQEPDPPDALAYFSRSPAVAALSST